MTPEYWQKVDEVLQGALDLPAQDRPSFLETACGEIAGLKEEAVALIHAYEQAGDFIEESAIIEDALVLMGESPDNNIGREIGQYRIVAALGSGGMGEVYLAEDLRLKRRVALKLLPPCFASDDSRLGRFQREARAASALNHPNILTIYEVGECQDVSFIATEFIDGETLRQLIEQQQLTLEDVLDTAMQVASALSVAHAAGIIHRDIKPENIMRRTDGIVKILDFGVAKLMEPQSHLSSFDRNEALQTETGVIVGTVGYMSPEQARGLPVDERTDIWSLGVVLYEMLAHRLPFTGATRMDTMVNILERPAPTLLFAEGSPPELQRLARLVGQTIRKEKGKRFQSATLLLAELRAVRHELERQGILTHTSLSHLLPSREAVQGSAGNSSDSVALPEGLSSETFAHLSSRRHWLYIFGVSILVLALLATPFLFSRMRAGRTATNAREPKVLVNTGASYAQMSETEQLAFIEDQAQRISRLMGDHPVKLNQEAVDSIKQRVDSYTSRIGSASVEAGKEDLRTPYARAVPYVPLIAKSFAARKIPIVVGLYLPMVESEYKNCFENSFGAKGLFQFMPQTARHYGVSEQEMCDVEKMTPAAAHYIADRMAELGDDSESMTLVLLSYNQGPERVRSALREVRGVENYERNFWTLFAHRDKLDEGFRREAGYVPAFFAAAIVGENPQNFGLPGPALSTLAK